MILKTLVLLALAVTLAWWALIFAGIPLQRAIVFSEHVLYSMIGD